MTDNTILALAGLATLVLLFGFLLVFMFRITKLVMLAPFESEEEEKEQGPVVKALRMPERPNDFENFMRSGPWPEEEDEDEKKV